MGRRTPKNITEYIRWRRDQFVAETYLESGGHVSMQEIADLFNSGLTREMVRKIVDKHKLTNKPAKK